MKSIRIIRHENYPGKRILRKMGYISDQKGIINRYLREKEGWESHLLNTREFILRCLEKSRPESVTVLGSGWLLDFPLQEAYDICNNIYLCDITHPPQVLRKIKRLKGVTACEMDISCGLIRFFFDFARKNKRSKTLGLPEIPDIVVPHIIQGSYYISLNILNQLDIILLDYLKKFFSIPEDDLVALRKRIQENHLKYMRKGGCMITDVEEITENMQSEKQEHRNLVYTSIPAGKYYQEWIWDFDSIGYYRENRIVKMKVKAISF